MFFFVALRICIGWQFFYEGMWKYNSLSTTRPWSAEGYLKSAQGPLRPAFHKLAGDGPYDLNWIDYRKMEAKWDAWGSRFMAHYNLTKEQKGKLARIVNGNKNYSTTLSALPDSVDLEKYKKGITYDAEKKKLTVDGKWHITPVEKARLLRMVPDVGEDEEGKPTGGTELEREFYTALTGVYGAQARLGYKEKLAASLRGDAERVGLILEDISKIAKEQKKNPFKEFGNFKRFGDLDEYRALVAKCEQDVAERTTEFDQTHLDYSSAEVMAMKSDIVGPIKALESEMKLKARELLTPEQLAEGPVPPPMNALTISNYMTIAGLLILGLCLMIGLLTRTAAIFGAVMLFSFYMVSPPWPGIPPAPGPDHSLFVNKNLIEVVALLAIACTRSGLWCGVDAVIKRLFGKKKNGTAPGKGPIPIATVKS